MTNRWLFALVSLITLLLIFGSAALQRIVFKAEQADSAVFLTPSVATVKPDQIVKYHLQASFNASAVVAGAEFNLKYDPSLVQLEGAEISESWQAKKLIASDGQINWAILPSDMAGLTNTVSGTVEFGTINFKALGEGQTRVALLLAGTTLTAIDASQAPSIYNAVTSVQDAAITISNTAVLPPASTERAEMPSAAAIEDDYQTQRLVSVDELISSDAAMLFVRSNFPSAVLVEFGDQPTNLTNRLETANAESNEAAVRLNGLIPSQRYYYRVSLIDKSSNSQTVGSVRSLVTPAVAVNASSYQIETRLSPLSSRNQATVYMVVRDLTGAVITGVKPTIKTTLGSATISSVSGNSIYQASISSSLPSRQSVEVESRVADTTTVSRVTFDPNYLVETSSSVDNGKIPFQRNAQMLLIGLLAGLFILVLLFIKLAKVK